MIAITAARMILLLLLAMCDCYLLQLLHARSLPGAGMFAVVAACVIAVACVNAFICYMWHLLSIMACVIMPSDILSCPLLTQIIY